MAANDRMNQWIRAAAGRGPAPLTPTSVYASDPTGEPMRYLAPDPAAPPAHPPTNAGMGAGMVQPIKKPMTMNQILRRATGR